MSEVQARVAEVWLAHSSTTADGECRSCGVWIEDRLALAAHVAAVLAEAGLLAAHDCAACPDCIHDGNRCCGCYDGVCCKESDPGSDAGNLLLRLDDAGRQVADARQGMEAATARAEKAEKYAKELERRFDSVNSHGERADLIAERGAAYQRGMVEGARQVLAAVGSARTQTLGQLAMNAVVAMHAAAREAVARIEKGAGA